MPRFRMLIDYDGSAYCGWQIQTNNKTVQGEIQAALGVILKESCLVTGAGRTDTGVHARGQVAHAVLSNLPDLKRLKRSLNGILDPDIRIKDIADVSDDFHARYSAKWRIYHYQIAKSPQALIRNQCWLMAIPLDIDKMNDAAGRIIGEYDFTAFCRANMEVKNHVCTVIDANWRNKEELIIFSIKANRFLHGMVRALVGTLVDIGRGRLPVGEIENIISSKDRKYASQSAPAKGLILEKIIY